MYRENTNLISSMHVNSVWLFVVNTTKKNLFRDAKMTTIPYNCLKISSGNNFINKKNVNHDNFTKNIVKYYFQ